MDIRFDSHKLEKEVNDTSRLKRRYGERQANLIRRRLDELRAVDTLEDIRSLPGPRCHELLGDHAGQLSVDLVHPYRLIFMPAFPTPLRQNGGLDWSRVTAIVVLGVEDTHG